MNSRLSGNTLAVPVVDGLAGTLSACSRSRPATTSTLAIERCTARGGGLSGNGRLSDHRGLRGDGGLSDDGRRLGRAAAVPNSRSGNLVGEDVGSVLAVDVDPNAWVAHRVAARELDGRRAGGSLSSTSSDDKLGTLRVELGGVGLVKGQELVSDQVFAIGQSSGNRRGPSKFLQDDSIPPRALSQRAREETTLVDLEPVELGTVGTGAGTRALGHVDHDRALHVCPLSPFGGDLITSFDSGGELSGASLVVVVAGHAGSSRAHDGVERAVGTTDRALSAAIVWLVAWIGGTSDDVAGNTTMGGGLGDQEGGDSDEGSDQHVRFR